MTPAARLQSVIEILQQIETTPRPADAVISAFFRARRYIGAKDRSAIAEHAYSLMRYHGRLSWWLEYLKQDKTPRNYVIAEQILIRKRSTENLETSFSGGKFAPYPFSKTEAAFTRNLVGRTLDHPDMPQAIRLECPPWAEDSLRAALGARFAKEMEALLEPAALDLRINSVKGTRADVQTALEKAAIKAEPTPWSPLGLRVEGRPALSTLSLFKEGLIEIQDEGSQLIALLTDARPRQQVVDFCAGAGGKTLALAAIMKNKGRIIACDVLGNRLKRASERFRRAGLHNIETRALSTARDPWVKRHKEQFDRVLVDAPCSGTGTWRRNPDSRWRSLGPGLKDLIALQAEILVSAARLVKPGGRLIYATCSLLQEENERQIEKFLAVHPDFTVLPLPEIWSTVNPTAPLPCPGLFLRLTPGQHGTDGFFAAALQRKPQEKN